jgi:Outer membrane protein Omp28
MKKLLVIMLAMSMAFVACKKEEETTPYDNITVAQSQEAFVLLTTATWCVYCGQWGIPTFEEALAGEGSIDAARVNGISLQYSSSDPMYLEMANTLKTQYAIGGPPNVWIEFNNAYNLNPAGWKNAIVTRQAETSVTCGVGMYVEAEAGVYTVYVKANFFSTLSGTYNIAVYAVENHVTATQTGSTSDQHERVLRGEITANDAYGTQMFSGSSPEEYTALFTYDPASHISASNVQFVAVIYEMSGGVPVSSPNSNTY